MGAGKSSIGRRAARQLGRPFVDGDHEIERRTGSTVRELFTERGETGFREIEAEVVADLCGRTTPSVIATGGGAVLRDDNVAALRSAGTVVWLRAEPETLLRRTSRGRHRPLLDDGDPRATITALVAARAPRYAAAADVVVEVDRRRVADVVDDIVALAGSAP